MAGVCSKLGEGKARLFRAWTTWWGCDVKHSCICCGIYQTPEFNPRQRNNCQFSNHFELALWFLEKLSIYKPVKHCYKFITQTIVICYTYNIPWCEWYKWLWTSDIYLWLHYIKIYNFCLTSVISYLVSDLSTLYSQLKNILEYRTQTNSWDDRHFNSWQ